MPIESTQHLYNLPGPQGWEEMRPYTNEKFIPAPLTDGLGRRPSGDTLVWDKQAFTFVLEVAVILGSGCQFRQSLFYLSP